MDRPTAADVRAWSPPEFDWADAGYPAPSGSDPEPVALEKRVSWAVSEIESITGRPFQTILPPPDGSNALNLVPIAEEATVLKVMLNAISGTAEALEVLSAPWLRSFTAGSYSETRFSAAEVEGIQGRGAERIGSLGPEPLATLLLLLMTDDKRADWIYLLTGKIKPALAFTGMDFDGAGHEHGGQFVFGSGVTHGWPFSG